ncbi:hypothetical protein FOA52_011153 [Chlamydomonas sp. UWO 241]|nr:hypothetical protein FOA52_011153 [Chlamydomonas sp. UWO 241]
MTPAPSDAEGGSSGGGVLPPHLQALPRTARSVFLALSAYLPPAQRTRNDVKELEALLKACNGSDVAALGACNELWKALIAALPGYDSHWDLIGAVLNRISLDSGCRASALASGFSCALGDTAAVKARQARGDKQLERIGSMACAAVMLCTDAPANAVEPWVTKMCAAVLDSLERSQSKGSAMEAYNMLTVFIRALFAATGTGLSTIMATRFINNTFAGVQLLFRTARKGLLNVELTGVPKAQLPHQGHSTHVELKWHQARGAKPLEP